MDNKYTNPLRQLGKKLFQLREAIDLSSAQGGALVKQAIGITNAVRQVHAAMPSDGFMLCMHPRDKVYQSPAVLPGEVLKYAPVKPLAGAVQVVPGGEAVNEFYERMEQSSQLAVLELEEQTLEAAPKFDEKKNPVPEKILETLFAKTSEQRLAKP